jgi:hypothetical protein
MVKPHLLAFHRTRPLISVSWSARATVHRLFLGVFFLDRLKTRQDNIFLNELNIANFWNLNWNVFRL